MAHDRMSGNQLPLTHEYHALMLGTRRATVTTLIPELEGFGAIRNGRGSIMVLDRAKLDRWLAHPTYRGGCRSSTPGIVEAPVRRASNEARFFPPLIEQLRVGFGRLLVAYHFAKHPGPMAPSTMSALAAEGAQATRSLRSKWRVGSRQSNRKAGSST